MTDPAIDLRSANLIDFAPDSLAGDVEIIAMCVALDPELQSVGLAIINATILPRIADLDPPDPNVSGYQSTPTLEALAWGFRLDELQIWDTAPRAGKIALLQNIFAVRKKSGTRFAVRRIFDLLAVTGNVVEWWQDTPIAAAYTYRLRVIVTTSGVTLAQLQQVPELVYRFAGARNQLSELAVEAEPDAPLTIGASPMIGVYLIVGFGV